MPYIHRCDLGSVTLNQSSWPQRWKRKLSNKIKNKFIHHQLLAHLFSPSPLSLSFLLSLLIMSGGGSFSPTYACEKFLRSTSDHVNYITSEGAQRFIGQLQRLTDHFQKLITRLEKERDPTNYINEVLSRARSITELNTLAYQERILRAFVRSKDFTELHLKVSPERNKLLIDYALKFNETYLQALANCFAHLGVPWKLGLVQTPVGPIQGLELTIKAQDLSAIPAILEREKALRPIHHLVQKVHRFWQDHSVTQGTISLVYADIDLAYLQHEQQFGIFDQLGVASYQNGKIFLPYNVFANQFLAVPLLNHEFSHYQRDGRSFYITVNPAFDHQQNTIIVPGYPKHLNLSEVHAYAEALSVIQQIKSVNPDQFDLYYNSGLARLEQDTFNNLRRILPVVGQHLTSAQVVLHEMATDEALLDRNLDYKTIPIADGQQDLHHAQQRFEVLISYPVLQTLQDNNYQAQFFILHFPYNLTPENVTALNGLRAADDTDQDLKLKWKKFLRQVVSKELDHYLGLAQIFGQSLTGPQEAAKFWDTLHQK